MLEALAVGLLRGGWKQVQVVDQIGPYKSSKLMYKRRHFSPGGGCRHR